MARPRISELFEQEPSRWGGRGDPDLWQEMAGQLADASWPASAAALEHLLGETFERLSGHPLEYDALIYLARHAHGGMSSGMVSPEFYRQLDQDPKAGIECGVSVLVRLYGNERR